MSSTAPSTTRGQDTIITTPTTITTCPLRNGVKRINLNAILSGPKLEDRPLAVRCMVSTWASLLNLSRKGDAKAIWEMAKKSFGEETWENAVEEALKASSCSEQCESCGDGGVPVAGEQKFGEIRC